MQKANKRILSYLRIHKKEKRVLENMGNIVVFAPTIGGIWEIWGRCNPCWIFSDLSIYPTLFITFFFLRKYCDKKYDY